MRFDNLKYLNRQEY